MADDRKAAPKNESGTSTAKPSRASRAKAADADSDALSVTRSAKWDKPIDREGARVRGSAWWRSPASAALAHLHLGRRDVGAVLERLLGDSSATDPHQDVVEAPEDSEEAATTEDAPEK